MLRAAEAWKRTYPGAVAGVLVMRDVANPPADPALDGAVAACEAELRGRLGGHDRAALRALATIQPYVSYYGRFGKTYHVLLQLESVVLKGKAMPRTPVLVGAMVMAELAHGLLTAGHDLAAIEPPIVLDVATGRERYVLLNGREQEVQAGDMMMADTHGVISSVLYGPDARTRLRPETRDVLFAVYAPPGIGAPAVAGHLGALRSAVLVASPRAGVEILETRGTAAPG